MICGYSREVAINFNIIVSSENMFEFIPFCPFSSNNLNSQLSEGNLSLAKNQSIATQSDLEIIELEEKQQPSLTQHSKKQGSLNHNMVKQLIITIKQMMTPNIKLISSGDLNKVVREIWEHFINHKQANKEILKVLFDESTSIKLLSKYGFNKIVESYGMDAFKGAIQVIKQQMLYRMKNQNIKSHLLDRRVQNKERLQAFILYFLHEQLKKGKIANRQGERATEKIEKILKKAKEEQAFMDYVFSSASKEVFERFTSQTIEIS